MGGSALVEGDTDHVNVVVRLRPLSDAERQRGDLECVHADGDRKTVRWIAPSANRSSASATSAPPSVRSLTFDAALVGSNQADVLHATNTPALLNDALRGMHVTIFAYGQTGSGKTYTMSGPESLGAGHSRAPHDAGPEGLIPRALAALFDDPMLHQRVAVSASYLEIYNEQLNDLLNPSSTNMQLRWLAKSGCFVQDLVHGRLRIRLPDHPARARRVRGGGHPDRPRDRASRL